MLRELGSGRAAALEQTDTVDELKGELELNVRFLKKQKQKLNLKSIMLDSVVQLSSLSSLLYSGFIINIKPMCQMSINGRQV